VLHHRPCRCSVPRAHKSTADTSRSSRPLHKKKSSDTQIFATTRGLPGCVQGKGIDKARRGNGGDGPQQRQLGRVVPQPHKTVARTRSNKIAVTKSSNTHNPAHTQLQTNRKNLFLSLLFLVYHLPPCARGKVKTGFLRAADQRAKEPSCWPDTKLATALPRCTRTATHSIEHEGPRYTALQQKDQQKKQRAKKHFKTC
jgi:hypothetical protein